VFTRCSGVPALPPQPARTRPRRAASRLAGERFDLSSRELRVLALLFRRAGEVVSRNQLLDEVWGIEYFGTTRTLDQVIVRLRQKIEAGGCRHLLTVHGVGYRLELEPAG
jgi:DNA-binding response OmpR family regulator